MTTTHPRHEQVSRWIRSNIQDGTFSVGDKLPSENQLCERFGISRITARRGLHTLETDGLIERHQGLGSFVADTRDRGGLSRLTDSLSDFESAGLDTDTDVLMRETVEAPEEVASALSAEESSQVFRVDQLWIGNDEPLLVEQTWMTMMFAEMLEDEVGSWERLFTVLTERYKIEVPRGHIDIEAVNAPNDIARHLNVPWGRALLLLRRTFYSGSERPFMFQKRFYRCDRFTYRLVLSQAADQRISPPGYLPLSAFVPLISTESDI